MTELKRIHSSDTQVLFDSNIITGMISSSIETSREYQDIRELSKLYNTNKVLKSNQKSSLNFGYLLIQDGYDPFKIGLLNIDTKEIKIKDLAGEITAGGCYLEDCSFSFSVGEIPEGSVTFSADTMIYDTENGLTYNDQTQHQNVNTFRPQEITVSSDPQFIEGIDGCDENGCSFCIQSASVEVSIERKPINIVGSRVPTFRYPQLPINGSISFEAIKTQITGINLEPILCEKGSLFFKLENKAKNYLTQYEIKDCSLTSISESLDLDGNAALSFSYEFPLNNNSIVVS